MIKANPTSLQAMDSAHSTFWLDGADGQEDEMDDVHHGIFNAPTNDEGACEVAESNKGDVALEKEDGEGLLN